MQRTDNCLAKLDLNYRYSVTEHISLVAGPSFNTYSSEVRVDDRFGTLNSPDHAHTIVHEDSQRWTWVGFNAGLALRL